MELGTRLKEARESKNLSLESLQEKTKIQKRYLEAIEQGNFKVLPGKFYARAFIKEYATAVGLDPNELLDEYQSEIPQSEEEDTTQYTQIPRSRRNNNPTKSSNAVFSFIPALIVILLVVGILFAAYYFYQQTANDNGTEPVERQDDSEVIRPNEDEADTSAPEKTDQNKDETSENNDDNADQGNGSDSEEPAAPEPELKLVETGSGGSPRSTFDLVNAGEKVTLTLEPVGAVWLNVENADGNSLYTNTLAAEDEPVEVDISDQKQVVVNIGHAPSLNLTINGVQVEYPIDPEEKDHQYLVFNIKKASEQTNQN